MYAHNNVLERADTQPHTLHTHTLVRVLQKRRTKNGREAKSNKNKWKKQKKDFFYT